MKSSRGKYLRLRSIKVKIMMSLIATICFVITLCTSLYYFKSLDHLENRIGSESLGSLVQLDKNMTNRFVDINNIVKPIFINRDVQELLTDGNKDIEMLVSLRMLFSQLIDANYYIDNMILLDKDFEKLFDIKAIVKDKNLYNAIKNYSIQQENFYTWYGPFYIYSEKSNEPKIYYIKCMPIRKISNFNQIKGYLCICIDESKIKDTYLNTIANTESSIGIIDNNTIFSSTNEHLIGKSIDVMRELYGEKSINQDDSFQIEKSQMFTTYTSKELGYRYYRIDNLDAFNLEKKSIIQNSVIIILISFSVAFVLGLALVSNILNPLHDLKQKMLLTEKGDFNAVVAIHNDDEIGELAEVYNHMTKKIKDLIENTRILERKKRETELYVLQTQINPHFIYNTLTTIKWLAVKFGEEELSDLISNFGLVLRSSISLGRQFLKVSQEIECLKSYIAIQKVRFHDQFDVKFHIQEEVMDCIILKFMIQTLLENAISHGIEPKEGKGIIHITCQRQEDRLFFCVEDNGIGMKQDELEGIRNRLKMDHFEGLKKSIGLLNLKERLQIYYGEAYEVYIESAMGMGTKVYFYTPIQVEESETKNFTLP